MADINVNAKQQKAWNAANTFVVQTLADLPAPVAGVITLVSGYYRIMGFIDLGSLQINIPPNAIVEFEGLGTYLSGFIKDGTNAMFINTSGDLLELNIRKMSLINVDGANRSDIFDISNSTVIQDSGLYLFESVVAGCDCIGAVGKLESVLFNYTGFQDSCVGLNFTDCASILFQFCRIIRTPNLSGTFINFNGTTVDYDYVLINQCEFDTADTESLFYFNPASTFNRVAVTGCTRNSTGAAFKSGSLNENATNFNFSGCVNIPTTTKQRCAVTKSADQSINPTTWTPLTFNQEDYDVGSLHDNSTNNTRLTATVAGEYEIDYKVKHDSMDKSSYQTRVRKNGSTTLEGTCDIGVGSKDTSAGTLFGKYPLTTLAVDDYIELEFYHDDDGAQNVLSNNTYFSMRRIY